MEVDKKSVEKLITYYWDTEEKNYLERLNDKQLKEYLKDGKVTHKDAYGLSLDKHIFITLSALKDAVDKSLED